MPPGAFMTRLSMNVALGVANLISAVCSSGVSTVTPASTERRGAPTFGSAWRSNEYFTGQS